VTEIEISPLGLALGNNFIEHVLLIAVLYQSSKPFKDKTQISQEQSNQFFMDAFIEATLQNNNSIKM
jgi:hypothetical protein